MPFRKGFTFNRLGILILTLFFVGCAGSGEKSELLSLLGVDEKIVDHSDQEVGKIYDALTLLKRGEANYVKEDYPAASEEYQRFLELHPFHRMAAFAQYRLGMSFYKQMNTNDRDPEPMEKAIVAFEKVVKDYPQSLYKREAEEKLEKLARRQAAHHLYVGRFYYKTGAYPAAIARFQKALSKGESQSLIEESLYYLGLSHYHAEHWNEARETFEKLLQEHPETKFSLKAKQVLSQLNTPSVSASTP
jgi:outer membrane protein assembly factor BamD